MSSNIEIQRICKYCGKEFTARTTKTQYCSLPCNSKAYKAKTRSGKIEVANSEILAAKTKPIEELKVKPFLSISETCQLLGISRRTVYRMIDRGEFNPGKAGKRTILQRSDIDNLFSKPHAEAALPKTSPEPMQYTISDCYTITEVLHKYPLSEKALHEIIKRNKIPRIKQGRFAYVPKLLIDKLLS